MRGGNTERKYARYANESGPGHRGGLLRPRQGRLHSTFYDTHQVDGAMDHPVSRAGPRRHSLLSELFRL